MKPNNSTDLTPWNSPSPDQPFLAELADKPKRPWLVFIAGLFLLLFIVALVVGPLLYFALPGELARWRIASAEERRLNGDLSGAIQDLDKALQEDPNNPQLLRKRAQCRREQKDFVAALEDSDKLIQLRPDDENFYLLRIEILQSMGRHPEAVAAAKRLVQMGSAQSKLERAMKLNWLAYSRALADQEIDEALIDIDEAIRSVGESYHLIDTRGYLYYRDGDLDRALNDLNRAVESGEEDWKSWLEKTKKGRLGISDRREIALQTRERARPVAVIRYHRLLVHEALGKKDLAEIDRNRVRELGFEPNDELF